MTVAELIVKLSALEHQDALVVIPGYEGGFDGATGVLAFTIRPNVDARGYDGEYESALEDDERGIWAAALGIWTG